MSLQKYVKKRDFTKTKEPVAGKSKDKNQLIFVIQKHDASRLHYDFRLEMDGVLKSWAVPKGPSTDPKTKRLAMMVEDHPFDYRDFEGTIPEGEYGGGTVIVWDHGTYEPIEPIKGKAAQEKELLRQLHTGSLKIKLHGEKLQGEFAFVKTHGMGENAWLLIKHKDDYASAKDITKLDTSVLSGKTIDNMAKNSDKVWQNGHEEDVSHTEDPAQTKDDTQTEDPKDSKDRGVSKNIRKSKDLKKSANASSSAKSKKRILPAAEKLTDSEEVAEQPDIDLKTLLKKGVKSKIPVNIKPMKATLVDEPFDNPDWLYEVKWDGYRALGSVNKGNAELISRNNKSFDKYYPIHDIMKNWQFDAVVDGEILVLNDKGISDFGALQNWRSEADGQLVYYVFDILWYEGKNLINLPLVQRLAILEKILPADNDSIRQSKVFKADGTEFFKAAEKIGLEGIIAKKADSLYTSDLRSKEWLKIKVQKRQEVVIAGFTKNAGTAKPFSALALGVYENGKLRYAGKVGTGFSIQLQKEMMAQFEPLITAKSPFEVEPDVDKPSRFRPKSMGAKPTWLKPSLVCEIAYAEVTGDGVFRQASFKGMRIDKKPEEVILEIPKDTADVVKEDQENESSALNASNESARGALNGSTHGASNGLAHNKSKTKSGASKDGTDHETKHESSSQKIVAHEAIKPPSNKDRKTLLNPKDETQMRNICGHELKFTHLSKIYWPDDKITKREFFNYYYQVAEYILPYLKDRPMSLNRFPGGINSKGFYQKDVTGKAPDWARTFAHTTDEGKHNNYLVGTDEASLLWMASLGCIEMNPWFSRIQSPDNPDYCVIDLDPDKNTFDQVVEAAQEVKKVLDAIGVPSYCKTSGSTGMHIYIPLEAKYTYDQSQMFAKIIVNLVHDQIPEFTSLERMIAERKGKMYLDFLQNRPGATIACPYSLRPKPGATVSMPLHWDEVKPGLKMKDFTIFNTVDRLKETGDLFKGVLGKGIDLEKVIEKAKSVFKK